MMPAQRSGAASMSLNTSGNRVSEGLVHGHVVGIAAVEVPAGEARGSGRDSHAPSGRRGRSRRCGPTRGSRCGHPGRTGSDSGPTASTRPTTSWPGMTKGCFGERSPSARWRSVRQTPQTLTRTLTCPTPGSGISRRTGARGWVRHRPGDVDGPSPHQRCRHHRLPSLAHSNSAPPGLPPTRPGGKAAITSGRCLRGDHPWRPFDTPMPLLSNAWPRTWPRLPGE